MRALPLLVTTLAVAATSALADEKPQNLPRLGASPDALSAIGVSSGGYMATQLVVAWPERFAGLAVLAAGPWSCAEGSLGQALAQCMSIRRGLPDLDDLALRRRDYEARDLVGEAAELSRLRAFVWHGRADNVIAPELGSALAEQLRDWLAVPDEQLEVVRSSGVGHGWPVQVDDTLPPGTLAECRSGGGTHVLACDRDVAVEAMRWLHGGTAAPGEADTPGEARLERFDQGDFEAKGLGETGYVLIPPECEAGGCEVTLALHGCGMSAEQIGETFVRHSGLNEWAAANRRVVLYPQAETSLANPQACWDWWGFAESTWQLDPLHDTREGTQARALMGMVERLTQQAPDSD